MNRLLSAGFARMWKSRAFHVMAVLFAIGGIGMRLFALYMGKQNDVEIPLDSLFYAAAAFIGIIMAIFVSLFVGTEYSDGTIRNKLVTGHTRISVYLSNLVLCTVAGWIFSAIYWIGSMLIGIPTCGFFKGSASSVLVPGGLYLLLVLAYSAIFNFIAMVNQNKAMVAVITLITAFVLFIASTVIFSKLNEPEYYDAYEYTENGITIKEGETKNPNFLRGTKREVYEFLFDFLPGCQGMRIAGMQNPAPEPMFGAYSAIIAVVMTAAGVFVFRKKNIK